MGVSSTVSRVVYWYSKDGVGVLAGKLLATILTGVAVYDSVFGTHYLGLVILVGVIVSVHILFAFGTLILKGLDMLGIINLGPDAEMVRKGFGLVTGIEDWYEMIVSYIWD